MKVYTNARARDIADKLGRPYQACLLQRGNGCATKGKKQVSKSQDITLEPLDDDEDEDEGEGEQDVVLEVGSAALREMDDAVRVPAVLHAMDDYVGDPEAMWEAVAAVMKPVRAWWSIPGWTGGPRVFRTDKDDLDRRAKAGRYPQGPGRSGSPNPGAARACHGRAGCTRP